MYKNISRMLLILGLFSGASCTKEGVKADYSSTSGKGGSLARFAIAGDYLYIVDKNNLKVYNISNPASPVHSHTTVAGFEIETIYPFKDKLFIGSTSVVHIFSIEDPGHPVKLSTAVSPQVLRRCDPVVAKDSVAYATLRTNGPCGGTQSILAVFNIKNILHPVQVNQDIVSEPYGLGYANNALYVCDRFALIVYDIQDPYQPLRVKQLADAEYIDVIPYENTLVCWTATGMALYDISKRLDPQLVTKIN